MPSFLGGKSDGAFGQPAFFLAGNCMTTVAFEKEVFFNKKPSLFSSMEVKFRTREKISNIYKWKEKVQKNTQLPLTKNVKLRF